MLSRNPFFASSTRNFWITVVLIFVICIAAKLHSSSVAMWDYYLDGANAKPQGVIAGGPQGIRSDEWMLGVPWVLSQVNSLPSLQNSNVSIGPDTSALLVGLPTKHWSSFFRPALWGYFLLDVEHAFSWQWIFRTFGLLVSLFLLFRGVSKNSNLLGITGALWVYFSGFNQWWLASVAELLLAFTASCVAFQFLWQARTVQRLLLAGALVLFWGVNFALTLYPPFQVPLFYLGLSLLPLLADGEKFDVPRISYKLRGLVFIIAGTIAGALVLLFLRDNQAVIGTMQQTVYPGQRITLGGGFDFIRYFSGIFDSTYLDGRIPLGYGNVCEASSFLLLWPLSLLVVGFNFKKHNWIRVLPLGLYLIWTSAWVLYGGEESLARYSLWTMVPSNRALIGLGYGSIVFVIVVMSRAVRSPRIIQILVGLILAIGLYYFVVCFDAFAQDLLPDQSLYLAAIGTLLACIAINASSRKILFVAVIAAVAIPNGLVNPVMQGMDSITRSPLYQEVMKIDTDKSEIWAVFGSVTAPQLVKAAGVKVFNGAKYAPDLASHKVLDPEGRYSDIYNRYAHGILNPMPEGSPTVFHLTQTDSWQLDIDPCSPALKQLGIRYIVFSPRRKDLNYSCLDTVKKHKRFSILKRNDF